MVSFALPLQCHNLIPRAVVGRIHCMVDVFDLGRGLCSRDDTAGYLERNKRSTVLC